MKIHWLSATAMNINADYQPLSDEEISKVADERFRESDRREAADGVDELPHVCPKCGGAMEEGFIAGLSTPRYLYPHYLTRWARGTSLGSFLFGVKLLPTRTFRCASCGYLESYAREEFALSWQFSLRTLLIGVTVFAIVLGFLVWALR